MVGAVLINVGLVIFNMLRAFQWTAGRVLHTLLAMRLGARRATDIAAKVGKGMAVIFAIVGLLGLPRLCPPGSNGSSRT